MITDIVSSSGWCAGSDRRLSASCKARRARPRERRLGNAVRAVVLRVQGREHGLAATSTLEKGPEPLLALVARSPLGDPARGLGPVRTLGHEPLRPPRRLRPRRAQL